MKALILENKICQIVEDKQTFEVHESLKWIDCPSDTTIDHTYENGQFVLHQPTYNYEVSRRMNHLPAGDQLDNIYKTFIHLKESGINLGEAGDTWVSQISAIKAKYPKPDQSIPLDN